jgi:uncharacterized protein YecE (DUF72 family)
MFWVGTSGYQYTEWRGNFYPEKLATTKMLSFYGQQFTTVEINYTFNRLPSESVLAKWKEQTPETFKFTLKAPKRITHYHTFADPNLLQVFVERAKLLEPKLGVLLFQFPPTFKKNIHYIGEVIEQMPGGVRAAFEFRHESWFDEELYQRLRSKNLALCIAQSENLSTPIVTTADYGYFRLRNQEYSAADIKRWAKEIRGIESWKDVFVYFKHEEEGTGPIFARKLIEQLNPKA